MTKSKPTSKVSLGTLYDVNKQLVNHCEELSEGDKRAKIDLLGKFIYDTDNEYYMLLCNDRKDYTIFRRTSGLAASSDVAYVVKECLENRGIIKGIDETEDKCAYEIWLTIDNESYCYYFFPYDSAIVEV